jgi:transposase
VQLEKRKEEVKRFFEELNETCEKLAEEQGVNSYFQDEEGTVYKIIQPEGKFVHFEKFSYVRTRRVDEKRGDLSIKEAEENGFKVPTK